MQNHFELFHLPQRFAIDMEALDKAYREVQSRVHPDKFSNATDAEKRVAMQWATRANEAYQTLKNPYKRAAYLCELRGAPIAEHDLATRAIVGAAFACLQAAHLASLAAGDPTTFARAIDTAMAAVTSRPPVPPE